MRLSIAALAAAALLALPGAAGAQVYQIPGSPPAVAPPPPVPNGGFLDTIGPTVRLQRTRVRMSKAGVVKVPFDCPPGEPAPCQGTVRLLTAVRPTNVRVSGAGFRIPPGATRSVRMKVAPRVRKMVRRRGQLRVRANVTARDRAGNVQKTTAVLFIKEPPPE